MLIDIVFIILDSLNITIPRGTLLYNLSGNFFVRGGAHTNRRHS